MLPSVLGRQGLRQLSHRARPSVPQAGRLRLQRHAMKTAFYAVDRLERDIAVLVSDSGATVQIPRVELPTGIREGAVLRVRFGAQNLPDWSSAVIDKEEERRRLREAKEMLDDLKRSDPGGDIKL
ncbi:MAG: hypothetical protein DMD38_01265 [Gemmatimonadetes bacterium]|nr:MAG: hypothetical protein DMD66_09835 [Gemmatimonadota bacterium]PYP98048.1 MAG: hypothetical protein DMD38_01265 [Gemmatimonadota bacterium]